MTGTIISILGFLIALCYGNLKGRRYDVHHNQTLDERHVFTQTEAESRVTCAILCSTVLTCWTASYHSKTGLCKMSTRSPRTEDLVLVDDFEWDVLHWNAICYDGWINTTDSCYLFGKDKLNWTNAQAYCQSYDSSLVEINDEEESGMLFSLLEHTQINATNKDDYYWIGLHGRGYEFVWSSSNKTAINYTNWESPQPPQSGFAFDNWCVELKQLKKLKWSYVECSEQQYFVCERHLN